MVRKCDLIFIGNIKNMVSLFVFIFLFNDISTQSFINCRLKKNLGTLIRYCFIQASSGATFQQIIVIYGRGNFVSV